MTNDQLHKNQQAYEPADHAGPSERTGKAPPAGRSSLLCRSHGSGTRSGALHPHAGLCAHSREDSAGDDASPSQQTLSGSDPPRHELSNREGPASLRVDGDPAELPTAVRTAPGARPLTLLVSSSGQVRMVYDERLDAGSLGELRITRASHVEPAASGGWTSDLRPVEGPVLGPFPRRSLALAAEIEWIDANVLN